MDIQRKPRKLRRAIVRGVLAVAALAVVGATTVYLSGLESAAPTVDKRSVLLGLVERGEMLREARGSGTLVPKEETWVTAVTGGRVKSMPLEPGVAVTPDTVLLELSNPDLDLAVLNAKWQRKAAVAELTAQKSDFQNRILTMETALAGLESDRKVTALRLRANEELLQDGLLSKLETSVSEAEMESAEKRLKSERKRLAMYRKSEMAELAIQEARVEQASALYDLKLSELDSLHVRAGVEGVLEWFPDELGVGKQVGIGSILAKISNPNDLKAVLKIPQVQARDAQVGLPVELEILNQDLAGRVMRIDPAVVEGSVEVDVEVLDPFPRGVRPDLSVVGTVEIERIDDVLHVGRPVFASMDSSTTLFKLVDDGEYAVRVSVRFGRSSVNYIEVLQGLEAGDEVILSDMSRWDSVDRLRIK